MTTIKRWEFRRHGCPDVLSTVYINRLGNLTVGLPYQYTTKLHGKWRPVLRDTHSV